MDRFLKRELTVAVCSKSRVEAIDKPSHLFAKHPSCFVGDLLLGIVGAKVPSRTSAISDAEDRSSLRRNGGGIARRERRAPRRFLRPTSLSKLGLIWPRPLSSEIRSSLLRVRACARDPPRCVSGRLPIPQDRISLPVLEAPATWQEHPAPATTNPGGSIFTAKATPVTPAPSGSAPRSICRSSLSAG